MAKATMTKREALGDFKENHLPAIRKLEEVRGYVDKPMRREAWNNYVDDLQKVGHVTREQADTWGNPF